MLKKYQNGIQQISAQQSILAIGIQDVDPSGLSPPKGTEILGSSSDHQIAHRQYAAHIDKQWH